MFLLLCVENFTDQCSQTCGAGVMYRKVECVTSKDQPSTLCRLEERPESQAACQDRQCEPPFFFILLGLRFCSKTYYYY